MKNKISIFKTQVQTLFVLLISAVTLNAQFVQWTHTYGSPGDDGSMSMLLTSDGGVVIAGFKSTAAYSYKDVLLMKTDASGNELWSRTYNLHLNDIGRSVRQTSDGGFIIAGMTEVSPQIFDPFLIKTDSAGILQWVHQYDYGFGDDDRAHAVWQTSDGGYVVAGQTWLMHGAFGNYDMYIFKTDLNGNVQWTKIFFRENEGGDVALSVQQLGDGGYIIGGFTQSSSWASYILRLNNLGNAVWSNIYPGSWQSECYDIKQTPDGGYIFTGTESSYETDTDLLLTKLDANGNLSWKKIYGTVDADQGNSVQRLADGGYIVAGMSANSSGYDLYIVRTNFAGDSLWSTTVGGNGDDRAFSVASTQAGTYYVSGWAWSFGLGQGDIYLVKLNESLTGNIGNNNGVLNQYFLSQNFPNPFNPVTSIKFGLQKAQNVELTIYDITGQPLEQIINGYLNAGIHEMSWDASNYSSGIYFYRINTNDFTETKRMMLVK